MKKLVIAAAALFALSSAAYAACSPGTNYSCYQGFGGKVICGCR